MLFTFPSQYWFAIGLSVVFSLARWFWQIQTGSHVSRLTQDTTRYSMHFVYGTVTLYGPPFQRVPLHMLSPRCGPTTPAAPKRFRFGLSPFRSPLLGGSLLVFFSSRYLDVSVPWVGTLRRVSRLHRDGLPHSEIHGSQGIMPLPVAYRSLSRPSSPLRAKASAVRP